MNLARKLFLLLRIPQWSKGVFIILGVFYSNMPGYWARAFWATLAFSLVASAVYIYNDIRDREEDKRHPKKSLRPLASSEVSVPFAVYALLILLVSGLTLGLVISVTLFLILVTYSLINLLYNHGLRNIFLLDVLCIASGFMLRILAGTIGIGLAISWWLALTATTLSLFIAFCKRRLELGLGVETYRKVLKQYSSRMLDVFIFGTAVSCFITYAFYTIYVHKASPYFMVTLPFCALGLWRFAYLSSGKSENDDPIALLAQDTILRLNALTFFVITLLALLR